MDTIDLKFHSLWFENSKWFVGKKFNGIKRHQTTDASNTHNTKKLTAQKNNKKYIKKNRNVNIFVIGKV